MIVRNKIFVGILFLIFLMLGWGVSLAVKIYNFADVNERQKVDAVVVMGASQWDGVPSPVFENRLKHAFDLYTEGWAENFILTGGTGEGEVLSESQVGKDYLINKGVKNENIFIEEKGRTSFQSLNEVKKILEDLNLKTVILVSDGFHMKRLEKMIGDLELEVYFSAVSRNLVNRLSEFRYVFREMTVYLIYLLIGI